MEVHSNTTGAAVAENLLSSQRDLGRVLSHLSEVVASNQVNGDEVEVERRRRLKRRADVQRDAPRFDGTSDLEAWWRKLN